MKAAVYRQTGAAADVFQITELETPSPSEGEVRVKIRASGINPTDTKTRAGVFPIQGGWERIVPHHDGAGVIDAVGENVPVSRLGERVWLHSVRYNGLVNGTAAEYLVVKQANAAALPGNMAFEAGATFGVPLLTAYHAVTMDGPVAGKTVLIQGGAGSVGNYAIQLACNKGAKVIATVSSDVKAQAASAAGAHEVINYLTENVTERVQEITNGQGADHLIEVNLSANALALPGLMKSGGFVAVYGSDEFTAQFPAVGAVIQQLRLGFFLIFCLPQDVLRLAIADLTEMLSAGNITAPIHACLPLGEIAKAHDMVDSTSTIGNVVLFMPEWNT